MRSEGDQKGGTSEREPDEKDIKRPRTLSNNQWAKNYPRGGKKPGVEREKNEKR